MSEKDFDFDFDFEKEYGFDTPEDTDAQQSLLCQPATVCEGPIQALP